MDIHSNGWLTIMHEVQEEYLRFFLMDDLLIEEYRVYRKNIVKDNLLFKDYDILQSL